MSVRIISWRLRLVTPVLSAIGTVWVMITLTSYWLGTFLIWVFAVPLDSVPASGAGGLDRLVLPALNLANGVCGGVLSMTAVPGGGALSSTRVWQRAECTSRYFQTCAARTSAGVVTFVYSQAVFLLGGVVITEAVFFVCWLFCSASS